MNHELARRVADAVLYEGYMLYPYRRSALKNRQRWSFGILYPPRYPEVQGGTERCAMRSEFLLETDSPAVLHIELRFLHLVNRQWTRPAKDAGDLQALSNAPPADAWDEGMQRVVEFEHAVDSAKQEVHFSVPAGLEMESPHGVEQPDGAIRNTQHALTGAVVVLAQNVRERVFKLSIDVANTTPLESESLDRNSALLRSLLSAHVIVTARAASFVSMLDPPESLREAVQACKNVGSFPVLVGNPGERDMLLCSPIILYDYPAIAPESAGDFYDATEMDEMLTLRLLTLTEDEKNQAKDGDFRVRDLLERTEENAREQLIKTHGVIRNLRPVDEKR